MCGTSLRLLPDDGERHARTKSNHGQKPVGVHWCVLLRDWPRGERGYGVLSMLLAARVRVLPVYPAA